MLTHLRLNIQFYLLVAIWVVSGAFLGNAAAIIVIASLFLLVARDYYAEIITAFWLMLIFSDSKLETLQFSQLLKKVLIVIMLLVLYLKRNALLTRPNEIFKLFIPFFLWSIIVIPRSPEILVALQKTFSYIFLFLLVPIFSNKAMEMDHKGYFRTLVYSIVFFLAIGLGMKYLSFDTVHIEGRFQSFMGNPNGLGLMVFLFALLFDTMNRKDPSVFSRIQRLVVWGVILLNLFFCQSRSSLFAFLIYLLFSNFKVLRSWFGLVLFLLLVGGYSYIISNLGPLVQQLGLENLIRLENLEEGSGRFIAWDFAWTHIKEDYLLGQGFAYTEWLYHLNYDMLSRLGHLGNAHNSFLTFWLDTGIIGVALFLIGFILLFLRLSKVSQTALPLMYAILFSANFESWLTASLNPNTIVVLLAISIMLFEIEPERPEQTIEDRSTN